MLDVCLEVPDTSTNGASCAMAEQILCSMIGEMTAVWYCYTLPRRSRRPGGRQPYQTRDETYSTVIVCMTMLLFPRMEESWNFYGRRSDGALAILWRAGLWCRGLQCQVGSSGPLKPPESHGSGCDHDHGIFPCFAVQSVMVPELPDPTRDSPRMEQGRDPRTQNGSDL